MNNWLGLVIGNSRLHWAWFQKDNLIETWDNQHLTIPVATESISPEILSLNLRKRALTQLPLYLASVVPKQTKLWLNYCNLTQITLKNIPLKNIYPSLGIDRALAVWGAGETYGYPCLVIDGGTALTFTGVDHNKQLIGGAILPGLRSQLLSLQQNTAALPKVTLPLSLPPRWALNTDEAIASGIIHTIVVGILDFIASWNQQFPDAKTILTGGDSELLLQYLQNKSPTIDSKLTIDRNLAFWGMRSICCRDV